MNSEQLDSKRNSYENKSLEQLLAISKQKIREATTSGNTEAEATVYVLNADPALTMAIINAKKAAKST